MSSLENYLPINLPSRCLVYDGIKPEDVKIRAYQGKDEVYLSEINPINLEQKFLQVLRDIVQGIDPELLTIGDKLYIVVWEYAKSYSNIVNVKTVCSHCLKEIEIGVNLGGLNVITLPDGFKQPYEIALPSGAKINLRLLTIKDEIEAEKFEEKNEEGLLFRLARSIVDGSDILQRIEKLRVMDTRDTATIRAFHEKFYHGPDMKVTFNCPKCRKDGDLEVPFRLDYFYPHGEALVESFGKRI